VTVTGRGGSPFSTMFAMRLWRKASVFFRDAGYDMLNTKYMLKAAMKASSTEVQEHTSSSSTLMTH